MSLLDYIKERSKNAENKKKQDIIISSKWEERAIKAVNDCIALILRISKKEIDRILLNNSPHKFEVIIVVDGPLKDKPSNENYPQSNAVASWSKDTIWGVMNYHGDAAIHVRNRKEQEYCVRKLEEKLIEEGFCIINEKKNKFRTLSSSYIITAKMSW